MTNEIDIYDAKQLNTATIKKFLKGGGNASDEELAMLLAISRNQNLNPFMKEVYFVKYGSSPAQIIVSRDAYRKRAQANPNYKGSEAGVIVLTESGEIKERNGAFKAPNEELIGAWSTVYLANADIPIHVAISYDEYVQLKDGKPNSMWANKPMTMLTKVAESQALRMAFPSEFSGTYGEEEFDIPKDVTPTDDDRYNRMEEIKKNLSNAKTLKDLSNFYKSLTSQEKSTYASRFEDARERILKSSEVLSGEVIDSDSDVLNVEDF